VHRHTEHAGEVITVSTEVVVCANLDINVKIACWTASETNFAVTGHLKSHAVFNACWNRDL
jgi:hypothetical protein